MAQTAEIVFRDFTTDGLPSSGANKVKKAEVRELLTGYEAAINGFQAGGGIVFQTKAAMTLTYAANQMAWVIGDSTVANNGVYQKQGASGSGSWLRVADLPYSFIRANNAGAGAPNAIIATSSIPLPVADGGALITVNVAASNTGPATISFNGGPALNIVSSSGNAMQAGYLTAGMQIAGFKVGSTFRLLSDAATAAIVALVEQSVADAQAAQTAAEAARDIAAGHASDAVSQGNVPIYATAVGMPDLAVPTGISGVRVNGHSSVGDGGGAFYKKVAVEPTHAGKFQSADGAWWEIAETTVRPQMFGAVADGTGDQSAALIKCIKSGFPIEWGGPKAIYRITSVIEETITFAVNWRSQGATIKYDGAGAPYAIVRLNIHPHEHQITGKITFDGNNKAHVGLYMTNAAGSITGSVYPSLTATDFKAVNFFRSVQAFGSTCGILILGDWEHVKLVRPYVKDVKMASAAHRPSIAGVSGIVVTRGTTDYPRRTTIIDPYVENIFCSDDGTNTNDQDGIVVFSRIGETSGSVADQSTVKIIGGTVKNSRGRSVKGQVRNALVTGLTVIKEGSVLDPSNIDKSMAKADIELQAGEGIVSDIDFQLMGFTCEDLIRVYSPDNLISAPSVVSGIRATITAVIPRALVFFAQKAAGERTSFIVSDIVAQGSVQYFLLFTDVNTATGMTAINMANVSGRATTAGILGSNALVASGLINMVNVANLSSSVPAYSGNGGWTVQKQNTFLLS
jgi:hypothetical protein